MKTLSIRLLIVLLFLTACQPSQDVPVEAMFTQTPASTATPVSISALDLSSVVFTEGDLPPGYTSEQINKDLGDLREVAPSPDAFFSQELSYNQQDGGSITLLLYEEETRIPQSYELIASAMPGQKKEVDIGEIGTITKTSADTVMLTFMRCHAVLSIQLVGRATMEDTLSYAARLDQRVSPLICRGGSHE